jgi:hypothetical protein
MDHGLKSCLQVVHHGTGWPRLTLKFADMGMGIPDALVKLWDVFLLV